MPPDLTARGLCVSQSSLWSHETDDGLVSTFVGTEVHHEQIRPPIRRVARDDLVGRNRYPALLEPCIPAIFGIWSATRHDPKLGLDRITGIATKAISLVEA